MKNVSSSETCRVRNTIALQSDLIDKSHNRGNHSKLVIIEFTVRHDKLRPIIETDKAQEAKSFIILFDRSYNEGKSERARTASRASRRNRQMVKSFRWLLTCGLRSIRIRAGTSWPSLIVTGTNESLCSVILLYPV